MIDVSDRKYWFDIDGKKIPNEESMLAKLLDEGPLFCNSRTYLDLDDKTPKEETIVVFYNCNDVFVPAADAISLTLSELPDLFEKYEKMGDDGCLLWLCVKQNEQPRERIITKLKERGTWSETFENLPENIYDKKNREIYPKN